MGSRGRKSANDLVTAHADIALIQRPDAPLDLTPEQSEVWLSVTNTMPADWFSAENYPLLAQYCRHVVNARRLSQLIDQECSTKEMDVRLYADLLTAEHKQTTALKVLAASMRLAQQARYGAQTSNTAKKRAGTVKRPWED